MSSISTVSSSTLRSFVEEPAGPAPSTVAKSGVAAGVAKASTDAPAVTSEILTRLGLLGLRSPGGTGDISVLLAQTLFGTDETRNEADKRRSSIAANAALALSGRYNTSALEAQVTTKTTERVTAAADLKTATQTRDEKKKAAETAATQLGNKQRDLSAAQTELANAKTPEEKKAAQDKVDVITGEVKTLQKSKDDADTAYQVADQRCTELTNQIAAIDQAIAALRGQISAINSALITVSLLFASQQSNEGDARGSQTRALDLDSEKLFEAITQLSLENARNANPLLREGSLDEAADEDIPPTRPVAVAAALQAALADLLRELNGFDPLLLARPPEQTGLDRLRLRV